MGNSIRTWLCIFLPWHHWFWLRRLSGQADLMQCCRCGQKWAMNHDVQAVLPYEEVEEFYDRLDHDIRDLRRSL